MLIYSRLKAAPTIFDIVYSISYRLFPTSKFRLRYLSTFRLPHSDFQLQFSVFCLLFLLLGNQLVAILDIGIANHDIRIQRRFFQGLVFSDPQGGVIDRLAGANGY